MEPFCEKSSPADLSSFWRSSHYYGLNLATETLEIYAVAQQRLLALNKSKNPFTKYGL